MKFDINRIKQTVSCRDLLALNGIDTDRKGKARCIFHDDSHASMHIFPDDGFKCFSCGAHGDVIDLACKLYDVDFNRACEILADQYGISPSQDDSWRHKLDEQRRKRQDHAVMVEKLRNEYFELVRKLHRLENNRFQYAPKSPDEPLNPLFVEAITHIDVVSDAVQKAEWRLHDAENEGR